jgi:hypothetical protein
VGARLRGVQQLFVLFHSPGAAWDRAVGFMEQPGIAARIAPDPGHRPSLDGADGLCAGRSPVA